ncbi:MAG: tetratricopeptide repeat protein [Pleomorphochaeta sp.]
MENYKKQLVLAKDKTDLKHFAKRQETIFQLENAKSDSFNISGPTSCHYIRTSNKLFDLYFEDEDYEEALDIAKEIFDIIQQNDDILLKSESIINLGLAYLKNGNITKAKEVAEIYSFDDTNPKYPSYCMFKASLLEVFNKQEEQLHYLKKAYEYAVKLKYKDEDISNILLSVALFYEKNKLYKQAYSIYLEIFNKSKILVSSLTDEERYSFLLRLANLAIINNEKEFAFDILVKSKKAMIEKFKPNHPLLKIINKALDSTENK